MSEFTKENLQASKYISMLADALEKTLDGARERTNLMVPSAEFAIALSAVMRSRGYKSTPAAPLLFDRSTGKISGQEAHAVYVSPKRKAKARP